MKHVIIFFITFWLSGCLATDAGQAAPGTQQNIVLVILGIFLFLGTLIYAAYKAFVELNVSYNQKDRLEYRSRAIGFFIGLLLTALIIAADTEQSPFSSSQTFELLPW